MKIQEMKNILTDANQSDAIPVIYGLARISQISNQKFNDIAYNIHNQFNIPIGEAKMLLHAIHESQRKNPVYQMDTDYEPIIFELWAHLVIPNIEGFVFNEISVKNLANFKHYVIDSLQLETTPKEYKTILDKVKPSEYNIAMKVLQYDLDEWLERFFKQTEGPAMYTDKASFARNQLIKYFDTGKTQPLTVNYTANDQIRLNIKDPSKPTFWSSDKLKDTDELLDLIHTHLFL